jgi:hypothetical protein
MTHPNFLGTLGEIRPAAAERIEKISKNFC